MNRKRFVLIMVALTLFGLSGATFPQEPVTVTIETNFSPNPDSRPIQEAWLREVQNATSSIRITLYSYTLAPLKDALIEAKVMRGVNVRVVADEIALNSLALDMWNNGIPIKRYCPNDSKDIMHDKVMIIDESTLATGSANLTVAAVQFNHENSIIIKS